MSRQVELATAKRAAAAMPLALICMLFAAGALHGSQTDGGAATGVTPADAVWVVALENALPEGKPLELHLAVHDGKLADALGRAPTFNKAVHDVDVSGLVVSGETLRGPVEVTIQPDLYMPQDGKPVACQFEVECSVAEGAVAGRYTGRYGSEERSGAVGGRLAPHFDPASDYGRFRLRFFGALVRLFRLRGPNYKYALDMRLTFPWQHGAAGPMRFETVVPDYRRYSAIVEKEDLRIDGHSLSGSVTVLVDYGRQGTRKISFHEERYVYEIDGKVIGDVAGGTWDARWADQSAQGGRFSGTLGRTPPPSPTDSIAFLRLHKAMQNDWPVLLVLALADDGLINGHAWAPGYNHQPHTVDASGLRLDGNELRGEVAVTIVPDCYKPPETFTMHHSLRATVTGAEVAGTFTGRDRGEQVAGAVTGELRAKDPPPVPVRLGTISRCVLDLGYSLVSGPMPKKDWEKHRPNYARVIFDLSGGTPTDVKVVNPSGADVFAAEVVERKLAIDGDRLTGAVSFDLESPVLKNGHYRYTFEAIVDGLSCVGYWRGTLDGEPILTKSAKLSGELALAGDTQRAHDPSGVRVERPGAYERLELAFPDVIDGRDVTFHLGWHGDRFGQAWAEVEGSTQIVDVVDARGLTYAGGVLKGTLRFWATISGGPETHLCLVDLDSTVRDGKVTGRYAAHHSVLTASRVYDTDDLVVRADEVSLFHYGQTLKGQVRGRWTAPARPDGATGEGLWRVEDLGSMIRPPLPWRHGGKTYVIAPGYAHDESAGTVGCVELRTGEEVWRITGVGENQESLYVAADHLFLDTTPEAPRGQPDRTPRLGCYRMTPEKATKVWELGEDLPYNAQNRPVMAYQGLVWHRAHAKGNTDSVLAEITTGAVAKRFQVSSARGFIYRVGPRVILQRDVSHGSNELFLFELGRKDPRHLGDELWPTWHTTTAGYWPVTLGHAVADGRLVMRGGRGIVCYDLRKD